jgi:hypothetical protein
VAAGGPEKPPAPAPAPAAAAAAAAPALTLPAAASALGAPLSAAGTPPAWPAALALRGVPAPPCAIAPSLHVAPAACAAGALAIPTRCVIGRHEDHWNFFVHLVTATRCDGEGAAWALERAAALAAAAAPAARPHLTAAAALALQQAVCDAVLAVANCDEAFLAAARARRGAPPPTLSFERERERGAAKPPLPPHQLPALLLSVDPAVLHAAAAACAADLAEESAAAELAPPKATTLRHAPTANPLFFPAWSQPAPAPEMHGEQDVVMGRE